jgi:hypothetical protein
MHFGKHHSHSTPEDTEALVQKLIDKSHVNIDPSEAKLIAKGAGIFHSRFSDSTTHAERKASWKKELEEIKQRKHLQHAADHGLHSSGSTTDILAGSSAAAGSARHTNTFPIASGDQNGPNSPTDCEELNENPSQASSSQDDQLADSSGPQTSDDPTTEDAQDDFDSRTPSGDLADESLAVDSEPRSPAANSPSPKLPQLTHTGQSPQNTRTDSRGASPSTSSAVPAKLRIRAPYPNQPTPPSSPVSNGSVTIKSTSQICDVIGQLQDERFFDPRNIAFLPAQ